MSDATDRYSRQTRFRAVGEAGQERIGAARVAVVGLGALGSTIANHLARAGFGHLRLIDRDFVELNNLQRQTLYDESDVAGMRAKAEAAARRLSAINSGVEYDPRVTDLTRTNVAELLSDVDFVLDGTDNFETRLLVNDYCVREGKPWVFGGCLGATGQTMTILPGESACLACLLGEDAESDARGADATEPTCETAGILGPTVALVASWQACEAIKLAVGDRRAANRGLILFDMWTNRLRSLAVPRMKNDACRACGERDFAYLDGRRGSSATKLCGRNAVQVGSDGAGRFGESAWAALADRLAAAGEVRQTRFLTRFVVDGYELNIFPDARAIVKGTEDESLARSLYARYVGC